MGKKKRGIGLKTINTWLRRIGLVLVVGTDAEAVAPIRFWIQRAYTYDHQARRGPTATR